MQKAACPPPLLLSLANYYLKICISLSLQRPHFGLVGEPDRTFPGRFPGVVKSDPEVSE